MIVDTIRADVLRALLAPTGRAHPHGVYRRLRDQPVALTDRGWILVSGYAECDQVLRDPAYRVSIGNRVLADTLLGIDGETHRRRRQPLAGEFNKHAVENLQPVAAHAAQQAAESLGTALRQDYADVVAHVASVVPARVIGAWAAIPEKDQRGLAAAAWRAHHLMEFGVPPSQLRAAVDAYHQLVASVSSSARAAGGATTGCSSYGPAPNDLHFDVALAVAAGSTTTVGLITTAIRLLVGHPDLTRSVAADRQVATALVKEALRLDGPAQLTVRIAGEDTTLSGVAVAAGTPVLLLLGAAGRDERSLAHPDALDVSRRNPPPLGFGSGPHRCLGSRLAMITAVETVRAVARLGQLEMVACQESGLLSARGPRRLLVRRSAR